MRHYAPRIIVRGSSLLSETDKGARWTVVDWKTDREIGARRATYERQVALYAEAIAKATGEPADGLLLVV